MLNKKKTPYQQNSLDPVLPPELDPTIPAPRLADLTANNTERTQRSPRRKGGQTSLDPVLPEAPKPKTKKKKWPVMVAVCLVAAIAAGFLFRCAPNPPAEEPKDDRPEQYAAAEALCETNPGQAAIAFYQLGDYQDARQRSFALWDKIAQRKTICFADYHIAAVKNDGTVVVAADTSVETVPGFDTIEARPKGLENVENWTDIIAIDTTLSHIVGLKADGTVVATGANTFGECNVSQWTDIVSIVAGSTAAYGGGNYTIGLKADGTLVFTGSKPFGNPTWTDVVKIFTQLSLLVGLKADGTVVAVGATYYGRHDVSKWTDITDICMTYKSIVGLKSDGTVIATTDSVTGGYTTTKWTDITAISTDGHYLYGIKTDGTLAVSPDPGYDLTALTDLAAVAGYAQGLVCLKTDGTVLAPYMWDGITGQPYWSAVDGWTDMVAIYDTNNHQGTCYIGLKRDGTVKVRSYFLPTGFLETLSQWSDIKLPTN